MQRHGRKGAAIGLAHRNLGIAWVLPQNDQPYRRQPDRQARVDGAEEIDMH